MRHSYRAGPFLGRGHSFRLEQLSSCPQFADGAPYSRCNSQIIERAGDTVAVPKAYLTSTKNVEAILTAMQQAQAPKQFSTTFLSNLGFKSNADRLFVGILKALGFLEPSGTPTQRYFEFLDQTQSGRILAEGLREAYADLFELNTAANVMTRDEVKNKLKTLTQGQFSDDVLGKMAGTFVALAAQADFKAVEAAKPPSDNPPEDLQAPPTPPAPNGDGPPRSRPPLDLVYNIELVLPESRDPAVYDALFRSLRAHLLND
jgi:hypothetical protein